MATRLYGIVWRWHFLAGLAAAPIVLVIALTGALYAFAPEIDRVQSPELLVVEPGPALVSLEAIVGAATGPRCAPTGLFVPSARDQSTQIYCANGHQVFVDPYRGARLGDRDGEAGWLHVVFELHWELLAGERGRLVIEWGTSWVVMLLISGAILWWPRGKRRGGGVWYPRRERSGRTWLRDLHAVVGIYALPVVMICAASGLMWTVKAGGERWKKLSADGVEEAWSAPPTSSPPAPDAPRVGLDRALAAAGYVRGQDPRAIYLAFPTAPTESYNFYLYDENHYTPWVTESVWVEAYTGAKQRAVGFADRSMLGKLDTLGYSLHVGAVLRLPGRILMTLAAVIVAALCVTGPWMWWKRRPRGGLGVPPRSRRVPWPAFVVIAGLGWVLPTVGWTLLVVIVVEVVLWAWRSWRLTRARPTA